MSIRPAPWLACCVACLSAAVAADDRPGVAAADDRPAPDGELLAASCQGCHHAVSEDGIPALSGLSSETLSALLLAYKENQRQGTVMNRIARGYSDAELRALGRALGNGTP